MKYKLTVVTTTYNQEKFVEECIKGVVSQKTNFNFQFLISDDCSTDNTRKIIEDYKKKYPDIIKPIYREKNLGSMENFIQTLNEVHTEYVALCDGDDFWTDNSKLQRQVDFLDANKKYNICFHKVKIFFEDKSQEPVIHPVKMKSNLTFDDLLKENFMTANSVVYRWIYRKKDSLINDFPKNIMPGDYYIHLMHANKGDIHYINRLMSCYRRNDQGVWWMTSQPQLKNLFCLKNGAALLNFYDNIEKKLNIDEKVFWGIKNCMVYDVVKAYFTYKKYIKVRKFYKKYHKKHAEAFSNFFCELSTFQKIIYVLITDVFYKFK